MRQAVISISGLCILAAVCGQIMKDSRFAGVIRMALGLEISRVLFLMLSELVRGVVEWS